MTARLENDLLVDTDRNYTNGTRLSWISPDTTSYENDEAFPAWLRAANRKLRYVVGESIVDAQIGYNFTEGTLKGLGLTLQVNNLNNAAYETYSGTRDRQLEYIKWGRSVMLGANYKF